MEFSWNPNIIKCTENPQSFISTHSFLLMSPVFQKYLNPHVRINNLVNSVVYHPCPSRLASLNSLGFYLSPEFLYIQPCVRKFFQFIVFTFLENALNLCIFTHALVPHSKFQVEFFENLFPPRWKGWRKLWFAISKFNQKIWRWLGTLVYLYFVWFVIFLNVMALQVCE